METLVIGKISQKELLTRACQVLRSGGLVVYPTETTYGLGVDATNQAAVDKLLAYKARRQGKPLSIAVADRTMAEQYVHLNEQAANLYQNFLPGPVTVVSLAKSGLARGVTSERQTVGVRIPDYSLVRQLIAAYGKPITATSANASYKKRPYHVSDILSNISAKQVGLIDLILDAGQLPRHEPSTVVDTTLDEPLVLRQGELKLTEATVTLTESEAATQALGGQLARQYRHYLNEKGLVFALVGEMGAGKTQLCKGIAKELGVSQTVISPTFTIAREYPFEVADQAYQFIHIDTWRLFSSQEFLELGFAKMIDSNAIIAIEWADKVGESLKAMSDEAKIVWVKLEYGAHEQQRRITVSDRAA